MEYCFVLQDLRGLDPMDPMNLQAEYAVRLGKFLCCDLEKGTLTDGAGEPVRAHGRAVLLRASCEHMRPAMALLQKQGASLLETPEQAEKLLWWDRTGIAARPILPVTRREFLEESLPEPVEKLLRREETVFLKSRSKGFSAVIASRRLLEREGAVMGFLRARPAWEDLMLSPVCEIGRDSLGTKESRHVVLDGQVRNSSRPLHSVRHRSSRKHLEKACQVAKMLAKYPDFPKNYVLDVGEFSLRGESFLDVVELNPLTSSMCYVNNTVFTELLPKAADFYAKTAMGYEYCLNALSCPGAYVMDRLSGVDYGYYSPESWRFL